MSNELEMRARELLARQLPTDDFWTQGRISRKDSPRSGSNGGAHYVYFAEADNE